MAVYNIVDCSCWRPWMSVTAPHPCPIHHVRVITFQRVGCNGRHCAHDAECFPGAF